MAGKYSLSSYLLPVTLAGVQLNRKNDNKNEILDKSEKY